MDQDKTSKAAVSTTAPTTPTLTEVAPDRLYYGQDPFAPPGELVNVIQGSFPLKPSGLYNVQTSFDGGRTWQTVQTTTNGPGPRHFSLIIAKGPMESYDRLVQVT